MNLIINFFIGITIFIIFYVFDFNINNLSTYMNNKVLTQVNLKLFIHNYFVSFFKKSIITNILFYIIIFFCEIIFLSFYGIQITNNFGKLPFYVLSLSFVDLISSYFNFKNINLLKGNMSFLIIETYFGHTFNIYELAGIGFSIIVNLIINNFV
jgi:hypothetical protein